MRNTDENNNLEQVKRILFNLLQVSLEKQICCCNNTQALGFLEQ